MRESDGNGEGEDQAMPAWLHQVEPIQPRHLRCRPLRSPDEEEEFYRGYQYARPPPLPPLGNEAASKDEKDAYDSAGGKGACALINDEEAVTKR